MRERELEYMPDQEESPGPAERILRRLEGRLPKVREQLRRITTGSERVRRDISATSDYTNGGPIKREPSVLPPVHKPGQDTSGRPTLPNRETPLPNHNRIGRFAQERRPQSLGQKGVQGTPQEYRWSNWSMSVPDRNGIGPATPETTWQRGPEPEEDDDA